MQSLRGNLNLEKWTYKTKVAFGGIRPGNPLIEERTYVSQDVLSAPEANSSLVHLH